MGVLGACFIEVVEVVDGDGVMVFAVCCRWAWKVRLWPASSDRGSDGSSVGRGSRGGDRHRGRVGRDRWSPAVGAGRCCL